MNEPQITLSGNVAATPSLRLAGGTPVTSFRVGATPRKLDRATDTWSDAETLWFTVTAWRGLAEHCASSLMKGDKVVVHGRLSQKTWAPDEGPARVGLEVDASVVGLDLASTSAVAVRKNNGPRAGEDAVAESADDPAGDGGPDEAPRDWLSSGLVDLDTGVVSMVPAVPEQDQAERETADV